MITINTSRRNFIKVGTLMLGGLSVRNLLAESISSDKSIIFIWAGGGMSSYESFDPHPDATEGFRSVTGIEKTNVAGLNLGGNFTELAKIADKYALVRSFAHGDPGHSGATELVLSNKPHRLADNGEPPINPSIGSIVSRFKGTNNPLNGIPTYIKTRGIFADGASWLGKQYEPFEPTGEGINNLSINLDKSRLLDRRVLLNKLDKFSNSIDKTGTAKGMDEYQQQSYNILSKNIKDAFDTNKESNFTKESYGTDDFGTSMLLARRLVENGSTFITVSEGSWDFHTDIKSQMIKKVPNFDKGIAALIKDIWDRDLQDKVMVIVTTEFSRTGLNSPIFLNSKKTPTWAGRDHSPNGIPLLISGGRFFGGNIIGETDKKGQSVKSNLVQPQDLFTTCFEFLNIPNTLQYDNNFGRPTNMIENGKSIS